MAFLYKSAQRFGVQNGVNTMQPRAEVRRVGRPGSPCRGEVAC